MPHLHLSLQAGDDLILKRMKRRHSRAKAIATARRARALRPEVAIGADLIAGFPDRRRRRCSSAASTSWMSAASRSCTSFPIARARARRRRACRRWRREIVRERAARLREAGAEALAADLAGRVGSIGEVLIEKPGHGRAAFYAAVACPPDVVRLRKMRFTGVAGGRLVGAPL